MAVVAELNSCVTRKKKGACLEPSRACRENGRGEAGRRGAEGCWRAGIAPPQPLRAGGGRGMAASPSKAVTVFSHVWGCRRKPSFPALCYPERLDTFPVPQASYRLVTAQWRPPSTCFSPLQLPCAGSLRRRWWGMLTGQRCGCRRGDQHVRSAGGWMQRQRAWWVGREGRRQHTCPVRVPTL